MKRGILIVGVLVGLIQPVLGQLKKLVSALTLPVEFADTVLIVPTTESPDFFARGTPNLAPYPKSGTDWVKTYLEEKLMAGEDTSGQKYRTYVWNIRLWVNERGKVDSTAFVKYHNAPLHAEIMQLMRQVEFIPGTDKNGKPVRKLIEMQSITEPLVTKRVLKKYSLKNQ